MKIVKKINNNVAIAQDENKKEIVVFGRGIGFHEIPYEVTDLSKIEQTFYNVDTRYYNILNEIPERTFLIVNRILEIAKTRIDGSLNPNLVFVLADHINFAVERSRKGMNIPMSYSYELEYEYPELTEISKWFVRKINEKMDINLDKSEVTSITMHLLNAMEKGGPVTDTSQNQTDRIIRNVTGIVEKFFEMKVDKNSFHYFRFQNHIKFFVQRKERKEEFSDTNEELFQSMSEAYPEVRACITKIDDYLEKEFGERCPNEELLYLMLHVNQLYRKEDCNRKGITPKE